MSATMRLLILVSANFIIVSATLYKLSYSGVDIEHSRLLDNAENFSFVFDFVSFLIISFMVNVIILTAKSRKRATIDRIIDILEQRKHKPEITKPHRKHPA